jgi:hypothetical protein
MNRRDFYRRLAQAKELSVATIETPFPLVISEHDGTAARLLLWLVDQMPPGATEQDLEDVLSAAVWWNTFLASMQWAEKMQDQKKEPQ